MRFDPLGVVEVAYAWHDRVDRWLDGIQRAIRPLDQGLGVYACIDEHSEPGVRRTVAGVWSEGPAAWMETVNALHAAAPPELVQALYPPGVAVAYASERARQLPPELLERWAHGFGTFGMRDCLATFGHDVDGRCVQVGIPLPAPRRLHVRTVACLTPISAHLTSALRLRRNGTAPSPGAPDTDAVITPGGRVAHAAGLARTAAARDRLARAARRVERARGPLRREDPEGALAVWRGLVDGRWSLVDHWDTDGRRFLLARRNAPAVRDPKALTRSERSVVAFLAMGHAVKYVAYLLGVSSSTVATQFASARRKLGVRSRQELVAMFSAAPRPGS
jgi:DNA-binding CsgD family transcriptional regulator